MFIAVCATRLAALDQSPEQHLQDCRGGGEAQVRGIRRPSAEDPAVAQERGAGGARQGASDGEAVHATQVRGRSAGGSTADRTPGGPRHRVLHV